MPDLLPSWFCRYVGFIMVLAGLVMGEVRLAAAEDTRCVFDIPAGLAEGSLRSFSEQAHAQFVFSADKVKGVRLNALKGSYTPRVALEHLVSGTELCVVQDDKTGALTVDKNRLLAMPIASTPTPNKQNVKKTNTLRHFMAALFVSAGAAQLPAQTTNTSPVVPETNQSAQSVPDTVIQLAPFEVSASSVGRYQASEVTSGSRVRISLMDSTQSVSVVTHDLIEDIGAGRILDAVKYTSGVYESTIPNAQDRTTVRGFQSDGATVDGFNYFTYNNLDPVVVDRIEVVKGPNAILAPQGVPGGTINNVSKKPQWKDRGSVTAQVGRYDANRVEMDDNRVLVEGKLAFRVVGAEQRSENTNAGNYKNSTTIMPMFTFRPKQGTELTVQAQVFNSWGGAYGGLPVDLYVGTNDKAKLISGVSEDLDLYTQMASRHSSGQYYRLLFTSVLTENLSMRLAANMQQFTGSSVGISIGNPNVTGLLVTRNEQTGEFAWNGVVRNDDPSFNRSGSVSYQTRRGYNLQNDYAYELKTDAVKSMTVAGFAVDYLRNPNHTVGFTMPSFSIHSFSVQPYTLGAANTSDQINYSKAQQLYLNETLSFLNDRVSINGGIARSKYTAYVTDFMPLSTTRLVPTKTNTPQVTLPSAGIVFKPLKGLSVFGGYSKQATANNPSTTSDLAAATQTSKQWEIGVRTQLLDQRLYSSLTYFDIKQNNFGVPNPANAFVPTPVPALPALLTNRLAHGVELELTYVVTKTISFIGNATVMKNRDTDGVPFRGTAEKAGAAWINYTAEKGRVLNGWSAGLGIDYIGERPGDLSQAFTTLSTPTSIIRQQPSFYLSARTLVNTKLGYRFNTHWNAQLNINNLLNTDYLAASTARNTVFPGTPFNPKLSVTFSF